MGWAIYSIFKNIRKVPSSGVLLAFCLFLISFSGSALAQSLSAEEEKLLLGNDSDSSYSEDAQDAAPSKKFELSRDDVDEDRLEEIEQAIIGPEKIPFDQVFVVQRRFIRKEGKQEVTPFMLGVQPADSFRRQFQWGFSWTYHFTESFAIEGLHAAFMTNYKTGLESDIKNTTGFLTDFGAIPVVILGSTLVWTPFKSKSATRDSVYHFETYLSAGGGAAFAETTNEAVGIFGLGFRAYLNRRSLLKFEVRDYLQFGGASKNRLSLMVGGALLL